MILSETRRRNLILLLRKTRVSGYPEFNELIGKDRTNATIRQIIQRTLVSTNAKKGGLIPRAMGGKTAQLIEEKLGLEKGWMDEERYCPEWLIDRVENLLDGRVVSDWHHELWLALYRQNAFKTSNLLYSVTLEDVLVQKGLMHYPEFENSNDDLRVFVVKNDFLKSVVKANEIIAIDFAIQSFIGFGVYLISRNGVEELMIIDNAEDKHLKIKSDYRGESLVNPDSLKILGKVKYCFNVTTL